MKISMKYPNKTILCSIKHGIWKISISVTVCILYFYIVSALVVGKMTLTATPPLLYNSTLIKGVSRLHFIATSMISFLTNNNNFFSMMYIYHCNSYKICSNKFHLNLCCTVVTNVVFLVWWPTEAFMTTNTSLSIKLLNLIFFPIVLFPSGLLMILFLFQW